MTDAIKDSMVAGAYMPSVLKTVEYGVGSLSKLPLVLDNLTCSRPFLVTGDSIKTKTPIIDDICKILAESEREFTLTNVYSSIKQHAPIAEIQHALYLFEEAAADCIIAVGGGSPIDSAKILTHRYYETSGIRIPVIAIPTTLSVAETTPSAGYTNEEGDKIALLDPYIAPRVIIYDASLLKYTPSRLLLSSGLRAVDHAFETLYHETVGEVPYKPLALSALADLFKYLPVYKADTSNLKVAQMLQTAAFQSLFPRFTLTTGLGLSHSLGHALGAKYSIPHGITSCITLASVLHYKAENNEEAAFQLERALPVLEIAKDPNSTSKQNAHKVADALDELVKSLGLATKISDYNVPADDADSIALHALGGKQDSPLLEDAIKLVKSMY
ncbi:dehydrogenase [Lipomyces arxii]|uniref:dehydrogenase n=1 Tax=Lipomyces arxii TaxID=56418 RepID=UPI0034CFF0E7